MATRRSTKEKLTQLPVSLTRVLRDHLEIASTASGNSLGEEVRRRLTRSFQEEARDQNLRSLLGDVAGVAEVLKFKTGCDWHSDAATHAAFQSALVALIGERKPAGSALFSAPHELFGTGVSVGDDPETIGRQAVRDYHIQQNSRSTS